MKLGWALRTDTNLSVEHPYFLSTPVFSPFLHMFLHMFTKILNLEFLYKASSGICEKRAIQPRDIDKYLSPERLKNVLLSSS